MPSTSTIGSDNRIGAVFSQRKSAQRLIEKLSRETQLPAEAIKLIAPKDRQFSQKVEGQSKPIGTRMLKDHITWGAGGLILGAAVAGLLVKFGPALTQQNPVFTFIALISPGLFSGLFISGLMALRPGHDRTTEKVRDSALDGDWTVLIAVPDNVKKDCIKSIMQSEKPKGMIVS